MDKETRESIDALRFKVYEISAQVGHTKSIVEQERETNVDIHREIFVKIDKTNALLRNGLSNRVLVLEQDFKNWSGMQTTRKADWKDYLTLLLAAVAIAVALFKNT